MKITFINKSNKPIYITLGENSAKLGVAQSETIETDSTVNTFTAQVDEASYITYALAKLGVVLRRNFKLSTEYGFTYSGDMTVSLYNDKRKGRYMDEYEKIVPKSAECTFTQVSCCVPDAEKLRGELSRANKQNNKAIRLFDVFDIIGNALTGLLLLIVPFILLWIFIDIDTACRVCGALYIMMFGVIVIFNRYMDRLKRKIWGILKAKKLEKDIFKDYNSYFESDYIDSVYARR